MGRIIALWQCAPSTCGASSAQVSRPLYFSYDLLGDVATEEDLVSGVIQYGYSPALEITAITNLSYTGSQNVPNLVSNVQNGPNGPTSWSLGNGLTGVAMYDVPNQAIRDGGWVCKGTAQTYCNGGTQLYGWVADTGSPVLPQSYDTINGHYLYGYDEFNRLTSTNMNSGQAAYSFTYDRWGNRTAQTLTAGSGWQWSASFNNLTNQVTGFSYDAAGNLLNDGSHSYLYDAEGNVLQVDSGATATYVYDALNRRVSAATPGGANEFVYDPANLRMSTWDPVTNWGTEGRIYWDGEQIAYRSGDGTAYLDHHDWLGSERLRTNYQGVAAAYIPTLAFGDGTTQTVGGVGVTQDSSGFASLEFDSLSNTDHAQYRQYSPAEGRWMSPDPYSGSYDLTNPQSLNRYSYVQNNPAWFHDPSGLQNGDPLPPGGDNCGLLCEGVTLGLVAGFDELLSLFDGPSFNGTLQPRPTVSNGTYTFQVNAYGTALYPNLSPALLGFGGLIAPNRTVPQNPCTQAGNAPDPSFYANRGASTLFNPVRLEQDLLKQFPRGGNLDAQPLGGSRAYGNYVYGAYLSAADVPLFIALAGANWYAGSSNAQYGNLPRDPSYPNIPPENVANIKAGYNAQRSGTLCHK